MGRIRTVKPGAFTSETLSEVSVEAERSFLGLLTQVDDEGRVKDQAGVLNGALWPLRPTHSVADMESDMQALADVGLVCRYVAGLKVAHVVTFTSHQRINRKTPSALPPCPIHDAPKGPIEGQFPNQTSL